MEDGWRQDSTHCEVEEEEEEGMIRHPQIKEQLSPSEVRARRETSCMRDVLVTVSLSGCVVIPSSAVGQQWVQSLRNVVTGRIPIRGNSLTVNNSFLP